ncbi:methyltransferase family protein [Streptomyces sp. KhCrAH-43]|uniref:class I SAM-dependent methyltransferase n=1 Tax=unclassified Streptomyces TaxID=2593676 RepID=UPI000379A3EB|nr:MULTISPECIES: class I SAM-dependent methyltransferase [unclassified Streptomyces]MYS35694.1 methyltransferase domain-containing protein [Streptomyces sp. SID4920]MYX68771.1 methyltransferase domain-containing protein [Streptomyces sp. SID8373]RAJ55001.1 methyltransferase family protein [Streptomyces sp. KhCrAH-43]
MILDYDQEAAVYDATRGGLPRAEAAAAAVLTLVPDTARTLLDIGCGTGLVTGRIAAGRPGLRVTGADASHGMARVARDRAGAVVLADARRLPLPGARVDAVCAVWLLHLLRDEGAVRAVVAEVARVLRPGGVFVTTVDKDACHDVGSDIDEAFTPYLVPAPSDGTDLVVAYAAEAGLEVTGDAFFPGHGQGRTPRSAARAVRRGYYASRLALPGEAAEDLARTLETLPDQERRRADPEYRLLALRRVAAG